ncbi:hypothetical protein G6F55_012278 [Rhizopus delemar]|uniref:HMG box domain-containing protein n=2 Tax=Rhizopus TaxID=4842 RepID=A0A9P6YR01_9FUNG|nr:hypothetical protein G6F55_012278 [Rhizopus delemar]KAG1507195.1 hypothetical protein G6F52_011695 [Rhizopus delemar]KAG1533517.1 hypothetical protein G6F51_012571 [Rhizopus arrhizus]KAG1558705.1 hypothetical protein G6F50_012482 [Rhizopus delemar]KAG1615756.1 hypothetical protein G6F45_012399 [Rhizopus arrhizus]
MKVHEITEEDFVALNVKRGHRRLIQREIATLNGIPKSQPIIVNSIPPSRVMKPTSSSSFYAISHKDNNTGGESSSGYASIRSSSSPFSSVMIDSNTVKETNSGKTSFDEDDENSDQSSNNGYIRKYKRHPKPDPNAPAKPPSAYVMFSNTARAQLKDHNLSFSDIAKIVGDRWKNLCAREKQLYERNAMRAKDEYMDAFNKYKQTQEYRDYQAYLTDFKSKQEEENKKIMRQRKRLKRDSPSSSSMKWQPGRL